MFLIISSMLPLIALSSNTEVDWDIAFRADLTCCALHAGNEANCAAELGSNCVWVTIDHAGYHQTGSQCLGSKFEKCIVDNPQGCCGGCCECSEPNKYKVPDNIKDPIEGPSGPACGIAPATPNPTVYVPGPESTFTTFGPPAPIEQELPGEVGSFIDAARGTTEQCATVSFTNCWTNPSVNGQNYDYSTADIYFTGVYKKNGNCCYKYSSYYSGNNNCISKTSEQSHLLFDIRCPTSDFSVVVADSSEHVLSYSNDGSTCYNGIKINTGCADDCVYEICIDYHNTDTCDYAKSWVMDKAGNAFSFMSLDGIPTCTVPHHDKQLVENGWFYGDGKQFSAIDSVLGWSVFIVSVVIAILFYKYYDNICSKDGKYKSIKDGDVNKGYSTFSSV